MKHLLLSLAAFAAFAADKPTRGEQLYRGQIPLAAKLEASEDELAPAATRCMNCHGPDGHGIAEAGAKGTNITGAALITRQPRRNGPATAYSLATFRIALRNGHDPANIILARAMPRYTISDVDTLALWQFLLKLK